MFRSSSSASPAATLPDTQAQRFRPELIRPDLAVVRGASVPYPYGGKPRVIMVDLDQQALQAAGCRRPTSAMRFSEQNVILPSGDVKIGQQRLSRSR